MTKMVMLDTRVFVSGADLSGNSSKIEIGEEWEAKKTTNFRSGGAEENLAGIGKVDISGEGQYDVGSADLPDDTFWANRRVLEPWSVGPTLASDAGVGSVFYTTRALRTKATLFGAVGDVAAWDAQAKGSWPLVRAIGAHPSGTARTATGSGTAQQVGLVGAGQFMYANLHVLSVSGTGPPSITVTVQSDDAVGFPSATTRGTFAAKTAIGGEALRIPGPIATDTWWRVGWTITGGSPSFLFLVTLGIE